MKILKMLLTVLLMILFSAYATAEELVYDDFVSSSNNWENVSWNSWWEDIDVQRNNTAQKSYQFGSEYANKKITIEVNIWVPRGGWRWIPRRGWVFISNRVNISIDGVIVQRQRWVNENTYLVRLQATLDQNGAFSLAVTPLSNYASIEDVRITTLSKVNQGSRDFSIRYREALPGNMVTIGNTILVAPKTQNSTICANYTNGLYEKDGNKANSLYYLCEYHTDPTQSFGTTKASLTLPETTTKIKWAGLYWQAIVTSPGNLKNMKVKIKHENASTYTEVGFDQLDWARDVGQRGYDSYSAFKDVTKLFQDNDWKSGDITVGDIPVYEGNIPSLGDYGAWALVVVYEDPNQPIQQFNIYDGWQRIDNTNVRETITISGFRTPKSRPIKARASLFTVEGDKYIDGDTLKIKPSKRAEEKKIADFRSRINTKPKFTRTPDPVNNQGIDIHSYNLGTTGEDIIEPNETKIDFKFASDPDPNRPGSQDRYWASMISFAAELYVPPICYDYNIRRNGVTLRAEDRKIETIGKGELSVNISIRSMEGDFDLELSKLKLRLTPNDGVDFLDARYSPNATNTLIDAIYSSTSSSQSPEIAIGADATSSGGTISRLERYFTQFKYTLTKDIYEGKFEVDLNASINFGSGAVPFTFSSENGTLPRCEQSEIYRPQWSSFNIERTNSGNIKPITKNNENQRFPLYTQIVGRDFQFSVVSYAADQGFRKELPISNTTVDIELIDASPYNDKGSFFKCNNTDPDIIQSFPNGNKNFFVQFPKTATSRVDLKDTKNIDVRTNTALRNAAFRMWILADKEDMIINHTCTKTNNACFEELYSKQQIQTLDKGHLCQSDCTTGLKTSIGLSGCYTCLKNNFAKAICSRDNFAIRPASYRIKISDNNESNDASQSGISLGINNKTAISATLAAGYLYKLDANATQFGSDAFAKGYGIDFTIPSNNDRISQFQFDPTTGSCIDTNNSDIGIRFDNGQIRGSIDSSTKKLQAHNLQRHTNVGIYNLHLEDQNWTIVDQKRYVNKEGKALKTFPGVDDCLPKDATISINGTVKTGCGISSTLPTGSTGKVYEDLHLRFEPYKFSLDDVNFTIDPNNGAGYLFMNDFNHSFYDDPIRHPLTMSALFNGTVSAMSKDDIITTNFTDSCAAKDVILSVGRTTNPTEVNIKDTKGNLVQFQQALQINASNISKITSTASGIDANVTLSKQGFTDTLTGNANIRLHTTFQKPNETVNPIDVNYTDLWASAPNASSSAGMSTHIPDGNHTYNDSIIYYFAKVTPYKKVYANIIQDSVRTPLFVDIYCDHLDGSCADRYNLTLPSRGQNVNIGWNAATMFNALTDGTTDLKPDNQGNITPGNPVAFSDGNGSRTDINVSAAGLARPVNIDTTVCPDPWLRFDLSDPNGCPHYKTKFIGGSGWSGVGDVGRAAGAESNRNPGPSRLSW